MIQQNDRTRTALFQSPMSLTGSSSDTIGRRKGQIDRSIFALHCLFFPSSFRTSLLIYELGGAADRFGDYFLHLVNFVLASGCNQCLNSKFPSPFCPLLRITKKSPPFLLSSKVPRLFAILRLDIASKVTAAMVGRIVVQFGPKNV